MNVKPSWKKLETYLVIALCTAMMGLIPLVLGDIQSLGIPPSYATMLGGVLATLSAALVGWFARLRHQAYVDAGLPDTSTAPQSLKGAVDALNK